MHTDEDDLAREHVWKLAALNEGMQHVRERVTHVPCSSEVAPCDSVLNDPRLNGGYDSSDSYLSRPSEWDGPSPPAAPTTSPCVKRPWWRRWLGRKR